MTVLEVLIAFFLPPVSVAMKKGLSSKVLIALLLQLSSLRSRHPPLPTAATAAVSAGDAAHHDGCSSRATRFFTCPGQRAYRATTTTSTGIVQAEE